MNKEYKEYKILDDQSRDRLNELIEKKKQAFDNIKPSQFVKSLGKDDFDYVDYKRIFDSAKYEYHTLIKARDIIELNEIDQEQADFMNEAAEEYEWIKGK